MNSPSAETRDIEVGVNAPERARNRMMGAGRIDNPYPVYDRLRAIAPVHPGSILEHFDVDSAGAGYGQHKGEQHFSAVSWDTVETVLRNPGIFSSAWYRPALRRVIGYSMIEMDEPDHRRHRGLIQSAFKRREVEQWQSRWIQPIVDRLVDDIAARQRADLYTELCAIVPVHTITSAFGVPAEEAPRFHELVVAVTGGTADPEGQWKATQEVSGRLREIIAERRQAPRDDLLSILTTVDFEDEEDGAYHKLSDEEILAFALLMLPAGAGTTYRGLGCLLLALLERPEQLQALRADRSLLEAAIEEGLRWEQPITVLGRVVTRDTELGGVTLPRGSVVEACVGAANHDPARWDDPHAFNIHRPRKTHVSFGSGPHTCIGIHLARLEMRTVISAVLDRLPDMRLDPGVEKPYITGLMFRMPTSVPVLLD